MEQSRLIRIYGIGLSEYNKLLREQNNCCAICGKPTKLAVDHNHVNGRVRGLLCFHCNTILGHAYDSIYILKKAADYMEKHSRIDSDDDPKILVEKLKDLGF